MRYSFTVWLLFIVAFVSVSAALDPDFFPCDLATEVNAFTDEPEDAKPTDTGGWNRIQHAISHTNSGVAGNAWPCLFFHEGWWDYEYCHGRWLRQFHAENGVVVSDLFLGIHPDALKPDDLVAKRHIRYVDGIHTLQRRLSRVRQPLDSDAQWFCSHGMNLRLRQLGHRLQKPSVVVSRLTNGDMCEARKKPRETRVVLTCDHKERTLIGFNVTEMATCEYIVFLVGAAPCDVLEQKKTYEMVPRAPTRNAHEPPQPKLSKPEGPNAPARAASKPARAEAPKKEEPMPQDLSTDDAANLKPTRYATNRDPKSSAAPTNGADDSKQSIDEGKELAAKEEKVEDDGEPDPDTMFFAL